MQPDSYAQVQLKMRFRTTKLLNYTPSSHDIVDVFGSQLATSMTNNGPAMGPLNLIAIDISH